MSFQDSLNRIVDVSTSWIRLLTECPMPVSKQLPSADVGPPGSAWNVCWGGEDVQAGPIGDLIPSRAVTAPQRGTEPVNIIDDVVDEWGRQSFRTSDPPSNW
jgi:hypothetical protein